MKYPSAFGPESSQPPQQQLQLVVHAGPLAGKGFPITGDTLTFGRDPDNDIVLDDSQVSRHHARLIRQDDEVIVEDLGSTNGTLVGGKRIQGQHVLQPADIISIGSSLFGVKGFTAPSTVGITQLALDQPKPAPGPRPVTPEPAVPSPKWEPAPQPKASQPAKSGKPSLSVLAIGGILALVVVVLIIAAVTAYLLTRDRSSAVADIPDVVITAPGDGSQVPVNLPVTVQATASDPAGVVRMELWVSGLKTAESISPVTEGQPTLTASFQWTPEAPGTYTLEIRAYNEQGAVSVPTVVTVNAVGGGPPPTDTPTPEPETPTPTVPSDPSLTTQTDLNVRAGPGIQYDLLGLLPTGTTAAVIGRSEDGQWWQIRFAPAPDGVGWVAADPAFSTADNVDSVPVVPAPPTPTASPTSTPTDTPTSTPVPPTNTPTPTPTDTPVPTDESETIEFNISPSSIEGGECVTVSWNVLGVKEVYFEGQGVAGTDSVIKCPQDTTTYELRVVKNDGSEQIIEQKVEVINPIVAAGTITLGPNETIDFDNGDVPGDDFSWSVSGDTRQFKAQAGVQIVPVGREDSLQDLSKSDCEDIPDHAFAEYKFLDGSEDVPDAPNRIRTRSAACYRTDEGRLGKLRFPEGRDNELTIEWLTWK